MQIKALHISLLLLGIALRFSYTVRTIHIELSTVFFYNQILVTLKEAVVFKFTNFVCENYNKSWLELHQCRLKAVKRNMTVLNLELTAFYPIYDATLEMQLYKKANWYKPWLLKSSVDCCRFLRKPYNAFAIIVYKLFREFTNMNHPCPMEVSRNFLTLYTNRAHEIIYNFSREICI